MYILIIIIIIIIIIIVEFGMFTTDDFQVVSLCVQQG